MTTPNRINFTAARVASFKCPNNKSESFLWDSTIPGLGIRARSGGSRNYIFQTKRDGRQVRKTIGKVDTWDISQAREEARRLQRLIDQGTTPSEEKQQKALERRIKAEEDARQSITLGDVWPVYVAAKTPKWSESSIKDHEKASQEPGLPRKRSKELTKAGALYPLLSVKLSELDSEYLSQWLKQESALRPTVTARAYRLLSACLRWCAEKDRPFSGLPALSSVVEVNDLKKSSVREQLTAPSAKRDALGEEQLEEWFKYVRLLDNRVIGSYLQILLLTGARREELAALKWDDMDVRWRSMTIKDKVEGERVIPLTPYAHSLINSLPKRNEYVFSSPNSKTGHIVNPRSSMVKTCTAAGIPPVTLHGLRRSFKSLAEWGGEVPVGVVAQIMGHKPSATAEKHYSVRPLDQLRKWHEKIEAWILGKAGIKQPAIENGSIHLIKGGLKIGQNITG